jgi:hypothetical protein
VRRAPLSQLLLRQPLSLRRQRRLGRSMDCKQNQCPLACPLSSSTSTWGTDRAPNLPLTTALR